MPWNVSQSDPCLRPRSSHSGYAYAGNRCRPTSVIDAGSDSGGVAITGAGPPASLITVAAPGVVGGAAVVVTGVAAGAAVPGGDAAGAPAGAGSGLACATSFAAEAAAEETRRIKEVRRGVRMRSIR